MTHALIKRKTTRYEPGDPGWPASPGQPWVPAHREARLEPRTMQWWGELPKGAVVLRLLKKGWKLIRFTELNYYWVAEQPYTPPRDAKPAVPSQTIVDLNLGWNSGARSEAFITHDGYAEFCISASVIGAFVGLNDEDADASYLGIEHALYFSHGIARVYEAGAEVSYIGEYADGDVFRIARTGTQITYQVNGEVVYTSSKPSTGAVFIDASLYAGDDAVLSPVVKSWGTGAAAVFMRPLSGLSGNKPYSEVSGRLACMVGGGREVIRVAVTGSIPPLTGRAGNKVYGEARVRLPVLQGESFGGLPVPSYAVGDNMLLPLMGVALGTTGGIGGVDGAMAGMIGRSSDHAYGEASVQLPALVGAAYAYEGNHAATLYEVLGAATPLTAQYELLVMMRTDLSVATVFAVQQLVDATATTAVSVAAGMDATALLEALMRTIVTVGSVLPVFDGESHVWVLNAETGASSRYDNYGFNSFGQLDGRYVGAKSDGLYLLEGDDDAGLPIQAMVDFGKTDFGSSTLKSVPTAYLGAASNGKLVLKVIVEGAEHYYTARDSSTQLQQQRIDLGRGLRANYFAFQLHNHAGDDFELDSIEFVPLASSRRI